METLSESDRQEIAWMDEKVEDVKGISGVYKVICAIIGVKKMTYKELYLITYGINKNKLGEERAKKDALNDVIRVYKENHGYLPNNVKEIN